jgi:hypothetical protein
MMAPVFLIWQDCAERMAVTVGLSGAGMTMGS